MATVTQCASVTQVAVLGGAGGGRALDRQKVGEPRVLGRLHALTQRRGQGEQCPSVMLTHNLHAR
jgi:hypothetical protein